MTSNQSICLAQTKDFASELEDIQQWLKRSANQCNPMNLFHCEGKEASVDQTTTDVTRNLENFLAGLTDLVAEYCMRPGAVNELIETLLRETVQNCKVIQFLLHLRHQQVANEDLRNEKPCIPHESDQHERQSVDTDVDKVPLTPPLIQDNSVGLMTGAEQENYNAFE